MTIEYIISRSKTYHIPLYNYENKYCYWLSVLQRLHTSNTLNKCVFNYFMTHDPNETDIETLLLKPVYIYAQFDGSDVSNANIIRVYDQVRAFMIESIPQLVHPFARNGFMPETLLVYYYCPIICHLFSSSFVSILDEIHINKIEFEAPLSTVRDSICEKYQFLDQTTHQNIIFTLYSQMLEHMKANNIQTVKLEPFVSATLEVYPNKDHTGGHAITIIYGLSDEDMTNEMFYIIDDQRSISPLHTYYTNRNERIYELSLRDVTDVTVAAINDVLHNQAHIDSGCKFSQRVTRYSLKFEDNFLSPSDELIKTDFRNKAAAIADLHVTRTNETAAMYETSNTTSTNTTPPQPISREKAISLISFGFIIGAIVGLIVTVVSVKVKAISSSLMKSHVIPFSSSD